MRWMVTGGCGYIGANVVRLLHDRGDEVTVLDDLSTGTRDRIGDARFVEGSVLDAAAVAKALDGASGVIHFAARKKVPESVEKPRWYYRENVGGLQVLLDTMIEADVRRIVYSSSASVYGIPETTPVPEDARLSPVSPYGETKAVGEWMLRASGDADGLRWIALRYFNVAGARPDGALGDPFAYNLIPLTFEALEHGRKPLITGTDFATPDGTGIRDYVHVLDLARAHLAAADALDGKHANRAYNVGTGRGFSVLEVYDAIRRVTGNDFEAQPTGRRPGDPAANVADVSAIEANLGWRAEHTDLDEIVSTAWKARSAVRKS